MDPSTNFLVNLILLGLALLPIGFIVWGIALILGYKSTPELRENIKLRKLGWISTEAEIVDKGQSPHNSGAAYFVTYRFTDSAGAASQIYTKTQRVSANQYSALLKGTITEAMCPPNRPNDAELVEQQATSIPAS
jgi:hypothetical protein